MTRPSWLRFVQDDGGRDVPMAAVALATSTGEHVGVVFRDEDNEPRFLHLAFHHKLTNDPLPVEGVAWVTPAIPEELLPSFAAMCERIWKRHGKKIPYGFAYNRTRFLHDGTLELGLDEHGLTCATFVLAVARSAGIELLAWEEWPTRPEDEARFAELVEMLRKHCRDAEHLASGGSDSLRQFAAWLANLPKCEGPGSFIARLTAVEQAHVFAARRWRVRKGIAP